MDWVWLLRIGVILFAGALGGIANAILVDGGFKETFKHSLSNGQQILLLGWKGNVLIGALAALIFWGTYGNIDMIEGKEMLRQGIGAIIAGFAGGKLFAQEAERRMFAASKADLAGALKQLTPKSERDK
jgi:hypothetical protein